MALRGWVRNTLAAAVFGLATTAWATAATPTPAPGQYTNTEGGNGHGTLTIKGTSFTLTTIGGNCHTCALEGTIEGGVGVAKDSNGACRITMSGTGSMLTLDSTGTVDACRDFCGARAGFDGEYLRPPAACTDRQRAARIEQSHKQYAAKDYDVARTTLTSLLSECGTFMDWIERDKAKSDLALTEYHRGDSAQCLAVLSDTVAVRAQKSNFNFMPPCDAENYAPTGKAILHNQALCQAPAKR
jgi:hypothetical protein